MRIWALEIRFFFSFFATLLAKIHRGNDVQQHPKCLDENMLARQLKHLVKQTGMKWCLSFHSDKGELTWWIMCVCARACYVIWLRRRVHLVSEIDLIFWVLVWTHGAPAASPAKHRLCHKQQTPACVNTQFRDANQQI